MYNKNPENNDLYFFLVVYLPNHVGDVDQSLINMPSYL